MNKDHVFYLGLAIVVLFFILKVGWHVFTVKLDYPMPKHVPTTSEEFIVKGDYDLSIMYVDLAIDDYDKAIKLNPNSQEAIKKKENALKIRDEQYRK